ncbi:sigma 54-interacting transcriptional regulator [Sedimentibacter sp.]|uniref:sigma-54 interaction domain-containing protein n=1 Tax=Sedimentibacter sp. TaxID=1960295 RepID=UPI00289721C8|nr:sigma 54-interacting transcriptional regulator [Sedimentibacter sp.]
MLVIKRHIAIVSYSYTASKFYEKQINELFDEYVITKTYNLVDNTVIKITNADLLAVTTTAYESIATIKQYFPANVPVVIMDTTFNRQALKSLMLLDEGTDALFVNISYKMVRETITRLSQLGINHINFVPYYPECDAPVDIKLAVTPGELELVPRYIPNIIDIGHRVMDSTTIVEIALRLKLEYLLERENFKNYFRSIITNNFSFDKLFGRFLRMESQFEILMEIIDAGIIGVNDNDIIFACNSKAVEITDINKKQAIDKSAEVYFPFLPFSECRLTRKKINNRLIKFNGVDINVTIAPIIRQNEYLGAFAIIQRFTEEESKQHNLRIQLLNKGHKAKYTFNNIIGESETIKKACAIAKKMSKNNSAVLISGESGTGKELFAHSIHNESDRRNYPFIAINCAAMPDNLLESELFGYEEGSFTGAKRGGKLGLFEFAHKGSIFLDEVEGMSPALQIKLLRVLQEGEIMHVGGYKIINVDVRIIAASNRSLEALVAEGSFRSDLYYRLNTLPIEIPPLRERDEDIMLLFEYIRNKLGGRFVLSSEVKHAFISHVWKGNVRELHNYVEYLTCLDKDYIKYDDLPNSFHKDLSMINKKNENNLDVNLLKKIAGNKLDDYYFVLEMLYEGYITQTNMGRNSIADRAKSLGRFLTQQEIRSILYDLNNLGLIKMSHGRGGSKINEQGIKVYNSLKDN